MSPDHSDAPRTRVVGADPRWVASLERALERRDLRPAGVEAPDLIVAGPGADARGADVPWVAVVAQEGDLAAALAVGADLALPASVGADALAGACVALARRASVRSDLDAAARLALEASPEAMRLLDADGAVVLANAAARALAESGVDWPGDPELCEDPATYRAAHAAAAEPGEKVLLEFRLPESGRTIARYIGPVYDADGRQLGRVVVDREVSGERAAQRIADEAIAVAAHELRTPLTSVIGYQELLLEGEAGPLRDEQRALLDVAARNARRLHAIVDGVISISQARAGQLCLTRAPLRVADVAVANVAAAQSRAAASGVELSLELVGDPEVVGDGARLRQAVDNLLSNGLKFTPPGGAVRVRVAARADHAVLEVADTGVGVPAHELPGLFQRFARASYAVHNQVPGAGLGLAIVKAVAEAHGGRVVLDSREGAGTTVRIELPLAR